ncbi:MAG: hypothetical protein J7K96_03530 [Desulfobacteraceae bacterium]|nr:hypothetical protein [Desulfobacteraceae bacterium]
MSTICPSCGSEQFEESISKHLLPIVYGEPAEWEEKIQHCQICGESGDFANENDSAIESAIESAKKQSINSMLDGLSELGIKMTYIERALELPARTIARWKSGGSSAASIALLRTIRTFPWILEVADSDFAPKIAKMKIVQESGRLLYDVMETNTKAVSIAVEVGMNAVNITASLELDHRFNPEDMITPTIENLAISGDLSCT